MGSDVENTWTFYPLVSKTVGVNVLLFEVEMLA